MRHRQLRSNDVAGMTGNYTAVANFEKQSDNVAVIQEFLTSWTVPSAPEFPHCFVHVHIWNGLQDYKGENLMQPVLSWIPMSMSWQVGCFYYIDGVQYNGEAVRVKPGDELQGRITFDGKTGENYTYSMEFTGENYQKTRVTADLPSAVNLAVLCLEPYTDNYLDLPPDPLIKMRDINVSLVPRNGVDPHPSNITWRLTNNGIITPSGINGVVVSDANGTGEVDFYFR